MDDLARARAWFAEEVRYAAGVRSSAITKAFATVPRERFLGPGPWLVCTAPAPDKYWQTDNADPRCVYHNVVIGIIPERGLNNGQPSFWAANFDQLDLAPGKSVLHLGCGTGYYTALLAEIVGPAGRVTALEIDEGLADRAREALKPWPQATVVGGDGSSYVPGEVDITVVNAGATHPLSIWLDALKPGGQLLMPMTAHSGWGRMLLITCPSKGNDLAARLVGHVGIFAFEGARNPDVAKVFGALLARGADPLEVKSLRRDAHAAEESCWLHGADFCLSRRDPAV